MYFHFFCVHFVVVVVLFCFLSFHARVPLCVNWILYAGGEALVRHLRCPRASTRLARATRPHTCRSDGCAARCGEFRVSYQWVNVVVVFYCCLCDHDSAAHEDSGTHKSPPSPPAGRLFFLSLDKAEMRVPGIDGNWNCAVWSSQDANV